MHRIALPFAFVLLVAACGGKRNVGTTTTTDPTGDPVEVDDGIIKQVIIGFATEQVGGPDADPPKTKIWLTVTDETGAARSYPAGEIDAGCSPEAGGALNAYGTLRCWYAGGGANYIVVGRGGELIILRQWTDEGMDEPADYEELTRVAVPAGAKVTFQQ